MKKTKSIFPPVDSADRDGLLAVSRDVNAEMLFDAYTHGIFPWPSDENFILWFAPPTRFILRFEDLHIPSRLARALRKKDFEFRVDTSFPEVIQASSEQPRPRQDGTWITPKMIVAYEEFHRLGFAHSFETFNREGRLVGGLYGVLIGKYFSGESMFYRESGASKFALLNTVSWLRERGLGWLDAQAETPHIAQFGGRNMERPAFMLLIKDALQSH